MKSIIEILNSIEKRPALYINRNDIFCLRSFLYGYYMGAKELPDYYILGDFQKWVEKKYRSETSHSWADIIHFYSRDPSHALDAFFKDFKKFKDEKGL